MSPRKLTALADRFEKRATTFDRDIQTAIHSVLALEGWLATLQYKYQDQPRVRPDFTEKMEGLRHAAHRIQKALANMKFVN
jgi:hypothetical protein